MASRSVPWEYSIPRPWRAGSRRPCAARAFGGYAGWGAGQLESEIRDDAWIDVGPQVDDVFTENPGTLWAEVLRRAGGSYRLMAMTPEDPLLN